MIEECWKPIKEFPNYSVSSHGRIRSELSERILSINQNQYGLAYVGLVRKGIQFHRSVPLLVARAFKPRKFGAFDTPINLDGDRMNNHLDNLEWRPRWFAVKYHQQFRHPQLHRIFDPIEDVKTGEITENSLECAKRYGLLELDVVLSISNCTYVWPTYQVFQIVID